ncbi:DNA/RNA non-specific endonuclease [Dellaglioa algida]|uniref:DNA/RNA non-specific endonuclease n=1 Tax=Dellaglioa algida TaxID=105612 RepID=UPI0024C49759|nr:DNA/RNA non-specific endonuclease [Dellaglioa algida]MDK1716593.1 DNA/RNA non-specific endonuclease [Dellaglioa algida]MDK1721535.1 DNA/RNA non-specific endonuclease [Dellaglioa algida]
MKMNKHILTSALILSFTFLGINNSSVALAKSETRITYDYTDKKEAQSINKKIDKEQKKLDTLNKEISELKTKLAKYDKNKSSKKVITTEKTSHKKSKTPSLSSLNYNGTNEIQVNNNNPDFSKNTLSTSNGTWESYSDLDSLNRAGVANAMLSKSLMPTAKRTGLTWNPTGWNNKRISSGWLYNRSHLIGYQLTGQNNNPKNLITGTRELNSPEMLAHEMDIATYLKEHPSNYIRYRVTPIFRGDELLARGVQMEAQSIGTSSIKFNTYIFNVEKGVKLNYDDGTSTLN